ncbi:TonB-dependent receptor [Parasphingopyxis algicola]|uniref:TonB-dependent receptor n=1 Tax=Parasphingopyxis algicola TaxID=2026624 RepID=UPI0015A2CCF5|nr:TonB-dependent receptor [Parasphingopyxis algicola]QLC24749.1 TonB-dependent receptor [Parasphingopyxis algicola]
MTGKRILSGVAPGAIIATLLSAPAAAQETAQGAAATGSQPIIVTAQRREQQLQDVPISVSAYSGDDLLDRQVGDLTNLTQIAPSVTFTQSTNALNSSVQIRGVGTSVFSSAVEPSVSFVVDGVVLSRQGQAFTDLIDIERIEVLRGPQSTLFGKNASAGVVNVVTQRPSRDFEFQADFTIAEMDEYRARGSVSGPISDTIGARLTGFYTDVGGHIENQFDDREFNGSERWGLRGKLEFDITPTINLLLIGDYRESDDECCMWQARQFTNPAFFAANPDIVPSPTNRETNVNAPVFNRTESWGVSAEANIDIGEHVLTSVTAYREWDFRNAIDVDGTPSIGIPGILGFDINNGETNIEQFTQEVRLTSPSGGLFEYIVGAFYFDLNLDRLFTRKLCLAGLSPEACPQISIPPAPGFPPILPLSQSGFFNGDVQNRNYAGFADVTVNIADNFRVIGGIRILREELDVGLVRPVQPLFAGDGVLNGEIAPANIFVDEDGDGNLDPIVQDGRIRDTAVTGRAVVQYDFSPDANIYASYSRGYKGPTADVAFDPDFVPGDRSIFPTVAPETSNAYEIGFRSQALNGAFTFNVSAFLADYDDFQSQSFDAVATTFVLSNVGQVRTKGVEIEFAAQPSDSFSLSGGISYTDAAVRSFPNGQCFTPAALDPDCVNGVKDLAGARLPNSPTWRAILNARYDQPLSDSLGGFIQAGMRWQSDTQFSITQNPNTIQDGYAIVDASVGLTADDGRYTVTLFVRNLFDTNYTNFIFQDPVLTGEVNLNQYAPRDADRYFGGSVRVRF